MLETSYKLKFIRMKCIENPNNNAAATIVITENLMDISLPNLEYKRMTTIKINPIAKKSQPRTHKMGAGATNSDDWNKNNAILYSDIFIVNDNNKYISKFF